MPAITGAAATAGALAYLDSRYRISHDMKVVSEVVRGGVYLAYLLLSGNYSPFYQIENWARKQPNKAALVFPKPLGKGQFEVQTWTYKELYDRILSWARILSSEYGIKSGDNVGLFFQNVPEFVVMIYAIWSLGAYPSLLNFNIKGQVLEHCIKVSQFNILFVDKEMMDRVKPSEVNCPLNKFVYCDDAFIAKADAAKPLRVPDSQRPGVDDIYTVPGGYIFTSGTTGMPKAGICNWRRVTNAACMYGKLIRLSKNDVFFSPMPLYHSTALLLGMLPVYITGATYVLGKHFSASTFWTQAKITNATYGQYVGETCRYLLNSPVHPDEKLHQIRTMTGNGLRSDIWDTFKSRFNVKNIAEFYGGTELPFLTSNFQEGDYGVGAVGSYGKIASSVLKYTSYAIVAVEAEDPSKLLRDPSTGFCRRCKSGESGELLFKIPDPANAEKTFPGYAHNKKATDSKIARDVFRKGDAYVRSGDLLRFDSDGMLLRFVDRMGDTFRWKSENVATNEVEHVLAKIPGVKEVVVVGVPVPKHEGKAGFAIIVPTDSSNPPDVNLIAKHASEHLPKFAIPVFIRFMDKLNRTGNNKVQKGLLAKQKIPHETETIYWFRNGKYVPVDLHNWKKVTSGHARL